jgi:hypothetical protein
VPLLPAGDLAEGEVLFLADHLKQRSVLLQVSQNTDNGLTVMPLTDRGAATSGFEKLYSDAADFVDFTFLPGARVIKLAAPKEYAYLTEDQGMALYRRTGTGPWELVIPRLQDFFFSETVSPERLTYEVSFLVVSEGAENTSVTQPVRLSLSPRALNRTFASQ